MPIDKNSPVHLYIQIADSIRAAVAAGVYPAGGALPTEEELCGQFGVSRYPMRQAMALLVEEGLLRRTRGKGTFVTLESVKPCNDAAAAAAPAARVKSIALVLPGLTGDFPVDILRGFERAAGERGYAAILAVTGAPEAEQAAIERIAGSGAAGIIVFPIYNTLLNGEALNRWMERGVYVSVIDRNPGIDHVDYVGSDNFGGGYLAAHHMHLQGYGAAAFISDKFGISSVRERCAGFRKALQRFGMRLICDEAAQEMGFASEETYLSLDGFISGLPRFRRLAPFAVFAENDYMAERVMTALREQGIAVGSEAGVIGFDNSTRCDYLSPRLTSVVQNGYLIGETAAKLAIEKIETGSRQSVRHILPTQLAVRQSCGEERSGRQQPAQS